MTSKSGTWRQHYKVHPAADVFPMMTDEELAELGEDIKANGLKFPIDARLILHDGADAEVEVFDGCNRLEAMERAGIKIVQHRHFNIGDFSDAEVVAHVISANIHRRHLTKQQQADLIVAAHKAAAEAPRHLGGVPPSSPAQGKRHVKGKAGSEKDPVKAAAVADAKKHGISKRTVERAMAKAKGKTAAPKTKSEPTKADDARNGGGEEQQSAPRSRRIPKGQSAASIAAARRVANELASSLRGIDRARANYLVEFGSLTEAEQQKELPIILEQMSICMLRGDGTEEDALGVLDACVRELGDFVNTHKQDKDSGKCATAPAIEGYAIDTPLSSIPPSPRKRKPSVH